MSSASVPWESGHIGAGPIFLARTSDEGRTTFLAARLCGEQIHLLAAHRLVEFVQVHSQEVFVGADLVALAGGLASQGSGEDVVILACLRELAASSRWIELPLLDRLVRFTGRDPDLKLRSLADLAGTSGESPIQRLRAAYLVLQQVLEG